MARKNRKFEEAIVRWWTERLEAAAKKKEKFTKKAQEVDRYFEADHSHLLEDEAFQAWCDLTGGALVTVNLAFQIRAWLAPNLYHRNPTRTVSMRTEDTVLVALAKVIEAYLNYTPNETGLAEQARSEIDEALLAGRGALYTGVDPTTGLVSSWQITIDDLLIDPDARCPEEAQWIAWRERLPTWELEETYGKRRTADLEPDRISEGSRAGAQFDLDQEQDDAERKLEELIRPEPGVTNDLVTVWRVYSKMGVGPRGREFPEEFRGKIDDSGRFRQIVLAPRHPVPLNDVASPKPAPRGGGWELPIYLDNAWPFTFLDLTQTRNKLWPTSLMAAAMPHQRAINLMASIWLEKAKQHAREIIAVAKGLSEEAKEQIKSGGLTEVVEIGNQELIGLGVDRLISKWDPGQISPEIEKQIQWHADQFAQTTGLLPILKGGGFEVQTRSATEADIKDKNARSRLQDMSERVEDHHSKVARNEGIAIRTLLDAEEVEELVEVDLGWLVSVKLLGVELPRRINRTDREARERRDQIAESAASGIPPAPESVEDLVPEAAGYYELEEQAVAAANAVLQAAASYGPILQPKIDVRKVTVADVWLDTQGLTPKQIMRETSYRVEAGSTKRPDHNKLISLAESVMQNVGQPALQLGDTVTFNRTMTLVYEAFQTPAGDRIFLPQPQQPQQPAPGAPAGAQAQGNLPPPRAPEQPQQLGGVA